MGCGDSTKVSTVEAQHKPARSQEAREGPTLLAPADGRVGNRPCALGKTPTHEGPTAQTKASNQGAAEESTIQIHVVQLGGQACALDVKPSANLLDVMAAIHLRLGHGARPQRLLLGETMLADTNAVLKDIGVTDGSVLTLLVSCEPIGQSSLEQPNGETHWDKTQLLSREFQGVPSGKMLNEFQFMSWQAVCKADERKNGRGLRGGLWSNADVDFPSGLEGKLGWGGLDLYWTTRADGCRYEYWSSDPGDNEYGVLVRVDANCMTAIGRGSDDGLELFDQELYDNEIIQELLKEGWPRFQSDDDDEEEDEEEEEEEQDDEEPGRVCNVCNADLVPGENWFHKPHSDNDVCRMHWLQLSERDQEDYTLIRVLSDLGEDMSADRRCIG